ncbi:RNase P subunit p30-domain-containing protein [Cyathus striatus]|nr:RNase P subunit p30-domain-containing protein [Cyathus striatus]
MASFGLSTPGKAVSKKGERKQPGSTYTQAQISAIETRVGSFTVRYSVIAFSQTEHKKVDPKIHINVLDSLVPKLRQHPGIVLLKRLNIILDGDSEKGFGLINANVPLFNNYDLIALVPTNQVTFSFACLTHTLPSALTAHIIPLPLTLPRLNLYLKHTLVRTALKNGGVFEINYVGALGGEQDAVLSDANAAESGLSVKRNWWAAAREVVRVTKGKGLLVSEGVVSDGDLRAPRDVENLISMFGIAQDIAHSAVTKRPNCSLFEPIETRKTYRAIISECKLLPASATLSAAEAQDSSTSPSANGKKRSVEERKAVQGGGKKKETDGNGPP